MINSLESVSKSAAEWCKSKPSAIAREHAATKPDLRDFSLQREHSKVLRVLGLNRKLEIIRPEKGRATVVMTVKRYHSKMMDILVDSSKFQRLGLCESNDHTH